MAATPYATASANAVGLLLYQNSLSADLARRPWATCTPGGCAAPARCCCCAFWGVRPSTGGRVGRVRFEYRSL